MSVTLLEVLQNAQINLVENAHTGIGLTIGKEQLKNAITLLEKGYGIDDDFDTIMGEHENVAEVPDKD